MKKGLLATALSVGFLVSSTVPSFAATNSNIVPDNYCNNHHVQNRPSNATPNAVKVNVTGGKSFPSDYLTNQSKYSSPKSALASSSTIQPDSTWVQLYNEPTTISISIYTRDNTGAEQTYQYNTSSNFETYVKDVLPNEWYESWGNTTKGMESLKVGALAAKTYGWYHTIAGNYKDTTHNCMVTNGTKSQMYNAGSGASAPNCTSAVNAVSNQVIGDTKGDLVETGYYSTAPNDGYIMSQDGTYNDAMTECCIRTLLASGTVSLVYMR